MCGYTGDCAELFDYCNQEMIEAKVKLLLQMSLILIWGNSIQALKIMTIRSGAKLIISP